MVTREAERVPPFSLDKERYDQTHFMGRWQNTMEMTSPSNLLASDARITAALTLLKSFQVRRFASSYNQPLYIVHAAPPRQNTVRDAPSAPPPGVDQYLWMEGRGCGQSDGYTSDADSPHPPPYARSQPGTRSVPWISAHDVLRLGRWKV